MACCLGLHVPRSSRPLVTTELETTTSTCSTEALRRTHIFQIQGYMSLLSRTAAGEFVQSAAFDAGGYDFAVRYYPYGCTHARPGHVSVFVELVTPGAEARASCDQVLVPVSSAPRRRRRRRRRRRVVYYRTGPCLFRRSSSHGGARNGQCSFAKRSKVEELAYLNGDTIWIQCDVTVFQQPTNSVAWPAAAAALVEVPVVPPSELSGDLAKLLVDPGEPEADVTVFVGEEAAHGFVLWARCRKLYDRITGWSTVSISGSEVKPAVFRALLHYVYTDSLPAMDDLDAAGRAEMLSRLLAAAHLYGLERLKVICERTLCMGFHAGSS